MICVSECSDLDSDAVVRSVRVAGVLVRLRDDVTKTKDGTQVILVSVVFTWQRHRRQDVPPHRQTDRQTDRHAYIQTDNHIDISRQPITRL